MKKITIIMLCLVFVLPFPGNILAKELSRQEQYTYEEYQRDIWKMKSKYKKKLEVHTIGYSEYGRKLYGIKVGTGEKSILISGTHHGREWITALMVMKMVENQVKEEDLYNRMGDYSIWFVPMLNPDGVTIQQGEVRKFPLFSRMAIKKMNEGSKDFTHWKSNGRGVDLNRQYPAGWEELEGESSKPSFKNYKGEKPLEAKEVQAIVSLTDKIKPTLAVAYHSSGQEIFWQYNNKENSERDMSIASKLAATTGYELGKPDPDAIGAGYTDWFITTYHLPAFTIEICPTVEETSPPLSTFAEEWQRNRNVTEVLLQEAKQLENVHKKNLDYR